jgi:hypothetical protein
MRWAMGSILGSSGGWGGWPAPELGAALATMQLPVEAARGGQRSASGIGAHVPPLLVTLGCGGWAALMRSDTCAFTVDLEAIDAVDRLQRCLVAGWKRQKRRVHEGSNHMTTLRNSRCGKAWMQHHIWE